MEGCGCGCQGAGNCYIPKMPLIGGVMPMALSGFAGLGDDLSYATDPNTAVNTGDTLPSGDTYAGPATTLGSLWIGGIGLPVNAPISMPTSVATVPTPAPSASVAPAINWNPILQAWTNTSSAILKAVSGANPTYQAVGPGGTSVTTYGSMPTGSSLLSSTSTVAGIPITTLALIGIAAVVLMSMSNKR